MQREQPGREVDLIAHSQGGVVVDDFLTHEYHPADPDAAAARQRRHVVVAARGRAAGDGGAEIRDTAVGRAALDAVEEASPLPPPSSPAVRDLAEGSPLISHLWDDGVPDHVDFTTIGAAEDVVVPADHISVPGATEPTVAVDRRQRAQRDRAAIPMRCRSGARRAGGRAPPCVGLATAMRSAVAPSSSAGSSTPSGAAPPRHWEEQSDEHTGT